MIGIILGAGDGTRLKNSSGEACCKVLQKVAGLHLIEYALNNLIKIQVSDVYIVVGKDRELIKAAIGDDYKGLKITYIYQAEQKGLVNAMMQVLNAIKPNDAVLQLADEIFTGLKSESIAKIINEGSYDYCYGITYEDEPEKIKANYSVEVGENMLIGKCVEKPQHIVNNIKGTGFCIFKKEMLSLLKEIYDEENNAPADLCDVANLLTEQGKKGYAFCVADREFNINTSADLAQATEIIR